MASINELVGLNVTKQYRYDLAVVDENQPPRQEHTRGRICSDAFRIERSLLGLDTELLVQHVSHVGFKQHAFSYRTLDAVERAAHDGRYMPSIVWFNLFGPYQLGDEKQAFQLRLWSPKPGSWDVPTFGQSDLWVSCDAQREGVKAVFDSIYHAVANSYTR